MFHILVFCGANLVKEMARLRVNRYAHCEQRKSEIIPMGS